jgi:hypothetical protein
MAPVDRQHANPSIYGVCRDDAEDVTTAPRRAQHVAGSALIGAEDSHPASGLPNG